MRVRYSYSVTNTRDWLCITATIITALLCVALPRSVILTVLYTHGLEKIIIYMSTILVDSLVFFICWILCVIPFENVCNFSDPDVALSHWTDLFLDIINKHAPLKKKRVKHQTLPTWLNADIKQAMLLRDKCRKQKEFVEYKQQRNRVNYLVREAKKKYFNDLTGNEADISSMWRAINTLT